MHPHTAGGQELEQTLLCLPATLVYDFTKKENLQDRSLHCCPLASSCTVPSSSFCPGSKVSPSLWLDSDFPPTQGHSSSESPSTLPSVYKRENMLPFFPILVPFPSLVTISVSLFPSDMNSSKTVILTFPVLFSPSLPPPPQHPLGSPCTHF